jgi:hypothetical protein
VHKFAAPRRAERRIRYGTKVKHENRFGEDGKPWYRVVSIVSETSEVNLATFDKDGLAMSTGFLSSATSQVVGPSLEYTEDAGTHAYI